MSDEDTNRLFAIKKKQEKPDLTGNEFAKELLQSKRLISGWMESTPKLGAYSLEQTNFEPSSKIFRNEQWTWNSDKTVLSGEFDYSYTSPVGKIYLTRIPKAGKERKEIEEYLENGYNGDVW